MRFTAKKADVVITILWVVVIFLLVVVWASSKTTEQAEQNRLVVLVKNMYEFETPEDLLEGQQVIKEMLVDEEWERLRVDETLRTVNAYFKFKYSAARVHVVKTYPGAVVYWIENENIPSSDYWMLCADETGDGRYINVREYKLICNGGNQRINEFG